jgi:hypothetical protein
MMSEKLSKRLKDIVAYWRAMQSKVPAKAGNYATYVQALESIAPEVVALEQANEVLKARLAALEQACEPLVRAYAELGEGAKYLDGMPLHVYVGNEANAVVLEYDAADGAGALLVMGDVAQISRMVMLPTRAS